MMMSTVFKSAFLGSALGLAVLTDAGAFFNVEEPAPTDLTSLTAILCDGYFAREDVAVCGVGCVPTSAQRCPASRRIAQICAYLDTETDREECSEGCAETETLTTWLRAEQEALRAGRQLLQVGEGEFDRTLYEVVRYACLLEPEVEAEVPATGVGGASDPCDADGAADAMGEFCRMAAAIASVDVVVPRPPAEPAASVPPLYCPEPIAFLLKSAKSTAKKPYCAQAIGEGMVELNTCDQMNDMQIWSLTPSFADTYFIQSPYHELCMSTQFELVACGREVARFVVESTDFGWQFITLDDPDKPMCLEANTGKNKVQDKPCMDMAKEKSKQAKKQGWEAIPLLAPSMVR